MRISTTGFTQGHIESLARLQAGVQRTQSQVAAGTRLLTPADDPVAAARMDSGNARRVVRALEVCLGGGRHRQAAA